MSDSFDVDLEGGWNVAESSGTRPISAPCAICQTKGCSFLVIYRTKWVDCTVHQTSHREDADQEAGKFFGNAIWSSPYFWSPPESPLLLSDADTLGTPSPRILTRSNVEGWRWRLISGQSPMHRCYRIMCRCCFFTTSWIWCLLDGERSWGIWWSGHGTGEGFGTLSSLRYLIWKDWCMGSDGCGEKGSLLSHLAESMWEWKEMSWDERRRGAAEDQRWMVGQVGGIEGHLLVHQQ